MYKNLNTSRWILAVSFSIFPFAGLARAEQVPCDPSEQNTPTSIAPVQSFAEVNQALRIKAAPKQSRPLELRVGVGVIHEGMDEPGTWQQCGVEPCDYHGVVPSAEISLAKKVSNHSEFELGVRSIGLAEVNGLVCCSDDEFRSDLAKHIWEPNKPTTYWHGTSREYDAFLGYNYNFDYRGHHLFVGGQIDEFQTSGYVAIYDHQGGKLLEDFHRPKVREFGQAIKAGTSFGDCGRNKVYGQVIKNLTHSDAIHPPIDNGWGEGIYYSRSFGLIGQCKE